MDERYTSEYIMYLDMKLIGENSVRELDIDLEELTGIRSNLNYWLSDFYLYWSQQTDEKIFSTLGVHKEDLDSLYDTISIKLDRFYTQIQQLRDWEVVSCSILEDYHQYIVAVVYKSGQTGFINQ